MKSFLKKLSRGLWYLVWYSFATITVLAAAVFGLLRLALPLIGDYNQDIEKYAETYAGRPIKIMSLDAEWHGFSPSLVLNNVRLLSQDGKETLLQVSRARLDFNLYEMFRTRQVQFARFRLSGANLSLVRLPSGEFTMAGFESNSIEPKQEQQGEGVIDWLLSQGEISLHAKNFLFLDQMNRNRRYHFSDISLTLRNEADRHMIDGAVAFSEDKKQEFSFAIDLIGDVRSSREWSGSMYVSGTKMDVTGILGPVEFKGNRLTLGKSDFEIWSEWNNASLTGLQGKIALNNLSLENDGKTALIDIGNNTANSQQNSQPVLNITPEHVSYQKLSARFEWNKYDKGWRAQADNLVIENNYRQWPGSQLHIQQIEDDQAHRNISVQLSFARTDDIIPLFPVMFGKEGSYTKLVEHFKPSGDIAGLNFEWAESDNAFSLAAKARRISFQAYEKFPGFEGLSGKLRIQNDSGSFEFSTRKAKLSLPKVFRSDLALGHVTGTISWLKQKNSLVVSSRDMRINNKDVKSQAVLDIEIPDGDASPFVSVIANFRDADIANASNYYPYSIMGEGALKWLDTAFIKGNVVSGGVIVYGPIKEFPFTRGQGVFDVRLDAQNVTLDYAADWPQLKDADAQVLFRGKSLVVNSKHAKIFDSDVTDVKASIQDLRAKVLKLDIDGEISGPTQEKLKYLLTAPPLKARYEKGLSDLRTTGNSQLNLDMTLSISDSVDADIKGKLLISDNTLNPVQVPGLLDSISGEVTFDNKVFKGKGIKANLLEQPVVISVRTSRNKTRGNVVEYKAVGKFNAKHVTKLRFPLFYDMVDGDATWIVRFLIPEKADPQLVVDTSLKGVSLNLPYPFKKDKPDSRKLNVSVAFHDNSKSTMKVSYGGTFEGILEKDYNREVWLEKGEVRFGGGPAVLPVNPGLRIAGDIDYLSYDVWENLIQQLIEINNKNNPPANQQIKPEQPDPYFLLVNNIDLNAKNFEIFGQKDTKARILMDNKQTWLAINIESTKFSGNIKVPDDLANKPLMLDMNRLNITPLGESSGNTIDPRKLPSIKLNSRSLNYGDKKLGQVAVETLKQPNGLLVQQLIVKPRATIIKGHGDWVVEDDTEHSNLELVVDSTDLGKTMKDMGYVDTIAEGKGTLTAKLDWPAALLDPDLFQINGQVKFNLESGRILDIEPGGAARLFGLFSLQTLPRRLTLDFSDLFSKGLKFDVIKGDFKIENGDAYTSNVQLLGPNADVLLRGRIGIGTQDYDQKVRVTPHITDTTILLSIITSQPLLFLFQQLLKQDIDAATSFEYTLSGKWDNYKLTPIIKVAPAPDQQDDF